MVINLMPPRLGLTGTFFGPMTTLGRFKVQVASAKVDRRLLLLLMLLMEAICAWCLHLRPEFTLPLPTRRHVGVQHLPTGTSAFLARRQRAWHSAVLPRR